MVFQCLAVIVLASVLTLVGCDSDNNAQARVVGDPAVQHSGSATRNITLTLTPAQLDWVGRQIFRNECAGRFECLVHWNTGEAFPSLGIGHFIWYPEGVDGRFVESFPALIDYMRQRRVPIPGWLQRLEPFDAPWPDRQSFMTAGDSSRVAELREFLASTRGIQAEFIFHRARNSLERVIEAAPPGRKGEVVGRLEALSKTPGGVYAVMDYVNFKGEGLSTTERYKGEGWGLLQVLLEMRARAGKTALANFREAAGRVLARRAHNADNPIERERWLPGWLKRLETYAEPPETTFSS
ncbi:hypothetical protein [Marinobacter subterrani]|uniref:Uncharacterized protein n=1 Tax=Marinobacter subterrani TaxID=1658765 RepID=A0A0J7JA30_9GAMM|nr:hypothetical protein [Marinobacter subterrani]KMQ74829.1 hypothetical protein Msub_11022 [Marinobacter subterrani]